MMAAKTKSSYYMGSLDGLRLMSFLIIFINHMPGGMGIGFIAQNGPVAVELFFIISAYLLFRLLIAEDRKTGQIDLRNFYLRRSLRIYPLLIAYYGLTFIVRAGWEDGVARIRLLTTLANVDNIAVWFWNYNNSIPAVGHLWTLAFEFQVYLLLPFAFLAWRKWGTKRFLTGLVIVELVAFAARFLVVHTSAVAPSVADNPTIYVTPYLRPESILLGLALAASKPSWKPGWSMLTAIVATLVYAAVPHDNELYRYFPAAIMVAALLDAGLRWAPWRAFLSWAPVRNLGVISYGLYVFHIAAIWTVESLLHHPSFSLLTNRWVFILASLALTIAAATVSYRLLERPFLRLKLRFTAVDGRAGAPEEHWSDATDVLGGHLHAHTDEGATIDSPQQEQRPRAGS